ncbi:DoxX family protein [Granulicella sp. dw_53]|uniref:DoxX family protein n=1 Tax=Granulicella sp. dw_53 TaxID=2719792 RepID=UPI001BD5F334|nr:DoxX family protein [Granulicella sp. dw_53]
MTVLNAGETTTRTNSTEDVSKAQMWTGRGISAVIVLLLLMDAVAKFWKPLPVLEACAKLALPAEIITPIGVVLLVCTLLYAIPRTMVVGAILLTGYLGGAILTHLRLGDPLWSQTLFPVYLGVLIWLGLYLRDRRVRRLLFA